MTLEQLDALRKLIQMTTPGPWVWRGPSSDDPADLWTADGKDAIVCVQTTNDDVRFIQAMREYAEPLVEAAWQLAAELPAAWREDLESLQGIVERLGKERDEALATAEQMRKERDEALNRFEVLQELSDQMAHSAGLSARRMEQAQQSRAQAYKERNEARAENERLRADLAWVIGDPGCDGPDNDNMLQDGPCNICFKCVTRQRDKARTEVEQLQKMVREVNTLVNGALEVTDSMWVSVKIGTALREIQEMTKQEEE